MSYRKLSFVSILTCVTAGGLLLGIVVAEDGGQPDTPGQWTIMGQNLANSRSQAAERQISPATVGRLGLKWSFTTGGDVSATPTVGDGHVYFPDWSGNLYSVRADTGAVEWSHAIQDYTGQAGSMSRVSPAIFENELIVGDNLAQAKLHNGAHVMAIDRGTGRLLWMTQVDAHGAAIITGSPVVSGNVVYVGVSSNEEALAANDAYPCCTFRGSMVALNAHTGALLWKTFTVPDNGGKTGGYSGNAIWQPPAIDPGRGVLYIGVGNNYTVPQAVLDCQAQGRQDCAAADDYFDTALALDAATGTVKWSHRLQGFDVWTVACTSAPPGVNCPSPSSPDYDLGGSGPNLVGNIVGFGQKSGIYWALNPENGAIVWSTIVGPGSTLGGIEWGTATDGARIYAAIANRNHVSYQLQPNGPTINWGSWAALDVATGKIVWQIADPSPGAVDMGSVSVANGVLYAGSFPGGQMYGIRADTGAILWQFASGGAVVDGPSIVNGTVYWGSGYSHIKPGLPNNKVFAFSVPNSGGDH